MTEILRYLNLKFLLHLIEINARQKKPLAFLPSIVSNGKGPRQEEGHRLIVIT